MICLILSNKLLRLQTKKNTIQEWSPRYKVVQEFHVTTSSTSVKNARKPYQRSCNQLKDYMKDIGADDVLQDAEKIFDGDETSFGLCPKTGKVIAPKGCRNVYDIKMSNEKVTIKMLLVFSASGRAVDPTVVFTFIKPPRAITDSLPNEWFIVRSESGWMRCKLFFECVANRVNSCLAKENIKKPVIFFVDGHKSYPTLDLSNFRSQNGILYALPPNTTCIMQPAEETVRQWQNLTMLHFHLIKSGFRKCGLYSFGPNSVDFTKCIQNRLESLMPVCSQIRESEIETA
ncbi:hypothetical protein PR048_022315 [Dryococelus australis]|uniref:DDE-1 domain-containing protein n=1 Tax=Dryococelus australis TaxID=614101 RepID=A0ABQ9H0Q8_9NEOP|nr:hypothetical protein PR048_022315 [Dryococelus australis]